MRYQTIFCIISLGFLCACTKATMHDSSSPELNPYKEQLNQYWYNGQAEITSFKLNQARYGEMREGYAVMIFVTEDFSTETMTKADEKSLENISILKMNATRNFLTGIYPYSLMTSTFFPYENGVNSLKISNTSQEWCGHTYLELIEQKNGYELYNASYFQKEAQRTIELDKVYLEDDIWSQIRLNPNMIVLGEVEILPSFMYLRFSHIDIKPYKALLALNELGNGERVLSVDYIDLERALRITFEKKFPFKITGWEEDYSSGFGIKKQVLTTKASAVKIIRSDYWNKNSNADSIMREHLSLPY